MKFGTDKSEARPSGFIYQSRFVDERFTEIIKQPPPFENCEYELRISGTVSTDKRIMSFVNYLWGFEVTGGTNQYEPLTIINVEKYGMGYIAGIRLGDIITRINNVYTEGLTLLEAQLLIQRSGKNLQIFVKGDTDLEVDNEYSVCCWFKPRRRFPPIKVENRWGDDFAWNDKRKAVYKESNCFMVPSKNEDKVHEHDDHVRSEKAISNLIASDENVTTTELEPEPEPEPESEPEPKAPFIVTESDENTTSAFDNSISQHGTREGSAVPEAINGSSNGSATNNGVSSSNGFLTTNGTLSIN